MSPAVKRPVRIGGASGGFSDRVHAMTQLAKNGECDVIMGDWMSENTMTLHGAGKIANATKRAAMSGVPIEELAKDAMFAQNFIDCFLPAIPHLATNGIKLAVNAGASDTEILAKYVVKLCDDAGRPMKVAWVEGDDVTDAVNSLVSKGEQFESLMHGKRLEQWGFEPVCAQAYLGGLGIAEAFRQGADIVICGRVADAAPAIGAAAYVKYDPSRFQANSDQVVA